MHGPLEVPRKWMSVEVVFLNVHTTGIIEITLLTNGILQLLFF